MQFPHNPLVSTTAKLGGDGVKEKGNTMQTKPQHVTLDDLLKHKERSVRRLADELWREYETVETVPSVSITRDAFKILPFKPVLR